MFCMYNHVCLLRKGILKYNYCRGNCHPEILSKVRQYYNVPDFLPSDAEFSGTENIFFGYEIGAVMHVSIISI